MRQAIGWPRWWLISICGWGITALSVGVLLVLVFPSGLPTTVSPRYDSATVRLPAENGWGSGVAIGPHLVVTAAHVMMIEHTHKVRTQSPDVEIGGKRTVSELLWASETYDLAIISVPGIFALKYRNVYCGPTYPGQEIFISGYPAVTSSRSPTDGAVTTRGVVASHLQHADEVWHDYVLVDALGAPGASGGGVLDTTGRIVGIFVGMFGQPTRGGFLPSGYNVMVPSTALCRLMGR